MVRTCGKITLFPFFQDRTITGTNRTFIATEVQYKTIDFTNVIVRDSDLGIIDMDVDMRNCTFINSTLEVIGEGTKKLHVERTLFADSEMNIKGNSEVMIDSSDFTTRALAGSGDQRYMVSLYEVRNVIFTKLYLGAVETSDLATGTCLGIEMENITSAVIRDSVFTNIVSSNEKGSVVHMHSAQVHFENCTFRNNKAESGIIYATGASSIWNSNCTFRRNSAQMFGGVFYIENGVELNNGDCVFQGNAVTEAGSEGKINSTQLFTISN